jgi:hypothetical protein
MAMASFSAGLRLAPRSQSPFFRVAVAIVYTFE